MQWISLHRTNIIEKWGQRYVYRQTVKKQEEKGTPEDQAKKGGSKRTVGETMDFLAKQFSHNINHPQIIPRQWVTAGKALQQWTLGFLCPLPLSLSPHCCLSKIITLLKAASL